MHAHVVLYSGNRQIHLLDSGSTSDFVVEWSRSPAPHYLALPASGTAVGIATGVNDYVDVVVDVLDRHPAQVPGAFATVWECSMYVASGRLRLASPISATEDGDSMSVPSGWLRFRISMMQDPQCGSPCTGAANLSGMQEIWIQCWPADPSEAVLLRGRDPATGAFHPRDSAV